MASNISEVNVKVGFIFNERSLKMVERRLQSSGEKLSRLGDSISLSISAPLALLGVSAIKAAGEFESLELAMQSTFKNAGRSVSEANAELAALRKAAEAPGLDVPQAIAASIRLQSVGQSAESARATIVELANAVASTGGTAQNLEGVTVQFAQMISKGKVLAGDLRIVQENLPIISDLMQKAFGTKNGEDIQKLGISGKEFVEKITVEMSKLSRVEGGISNSIVNAGTAIKTFLASIGNEINKAFNVKKVLDDFGKTLQGVAASFAGLSDGTKRAIVQFGLALVALGPLVKVFGVLKLGAAQLVSLFSSSIAPILRYAAGLTTVGSAAAAAAAEEIAATKALELSKAATATHTALTESAIGIKKQNAAATKLLAAREVEAAASARLLAAQTAVSTAAMSDAFSKLKLALGIVGIVAAVSIAVYAMSESFNAAEFAAEKLADAQEEINKSTAAEIGLVNKNFAALKDETKGKFEKGKIVDELLKQYPEYLKGLNLESASVARLTEIQNGLNSSILRGVAERQKAQVVNDIYEKQATILRRIQQLKDGQKVTTSEAGLIDTGDLLAAGTISAAVIKKLEEQSASLGNQVGIVSGEFDRMFGTLESAPGFIDPALQAEYKLRDAYYETKDAVVSAKKAHGENAGALKEESKSAKLLKEVLSDIANERSRQDLLGAKSIEDEAKAIENGIKRLLDGGFKPTSTAIQNLKGDLSTLLGGAESLAQLQSWIDGAKELNAEIESLGEASKPQDTTGLAPSGGAQPLALGVSIDESTLEQYRSYAEQMGLINLQLQEGVLGFGEAFSKVSELVNSQGSMMEQIFVGMGAAVQDAASSGVSSFAALGQAAAGAAAKIVRAYIQQGVAAAVSKALGSAIPFPFNIAAAAAAGGVAAALFTKAIGAIGIKGFAKGTKDAPGGLALVGEKGPEIVNIPRHSQVYTAGQTKAMLNGGNGGTNVNVSGEFRVAGTDLVLVLERAQSKNQRRF